MYAQFRGSTSAARDVGNTFPTTRDQFDGLSPFDLINSFGDMSDIAPPPSGGRRGGGGGGGGGGPTAEELALKEQQKAAFAQALASITDGAAGFDATEAKLREALGGAQTRNAGIFNDLNANAAGVRQRVGQSFDTADQAIAALASQFAQRGQAVDQGASSLAEAFGGRAQATGGGVADLANAARVLNTQKRGFADQAQAQMGNVYGALQGDLNVGVGQGFDALIAKLTAERQARAQQAERERAQLMLQAANAGVQL